MNVFSPRLSVISCHSSHKRRTLTASLMIAIILIAGCGSKPSRPATKAPDGFPVKVTSCGRQTTYESAPRRAVANDINMVEMMLTLGLADQMAGVLGVGDRQILASLAEDYDQVEHLSDKYLTGLEPLLNVDADFLFAGWNYGLSEAEGLTPGTLAEKNISTYELTESCAHVMDGKKGTNIEETFTDLGNIGRIFGVSQRADKLIGSQRGILDEVTERLGDAAPVSVFVYDSGEDAPFTAPGLAIPTDLISRAGGINIFADLAKTWTTVSWEQVITHDPDCIVIVDYGEVTWQQKRDFMKNNPALREITGVRNNCFVALPYAALTPGVRNADAVRIIAETLHPRIP